MNQIKEALQAGWNDRIFLYYQQHVDANAVRPQDETGKEWQDIVTSLQNLVDKDKPKQTPTVKKQSNDQTGSLRD